MEPDMRTALIRAGREILGEPETPLDLRKVAERIGKSRTAPYLVFGPTEEGGGLAALKLAVAAHGLADLADRLDLVWAEPAPADDRLRRMAAVYLEFAAAHPRLFRLMFSSDGSHGGGVATVSPEFFEVLSQRGRLEGLLRRAVMEVQSEPDARGLAGDRFVATWAMLHGAALLMLDGQLALAGYGNTAREVSNAISRFLINAIHTK